MALALALSIAACGGGDDEGSADTEESSTTTEESSTTTEESSTTTASSDEAVEARFVETHTAAGVDTSSEEPDPRSFTDTFASDVPGIFVVYLLDDDAEVEVTWSREGQELVRDSLQVPGGQWAEHHVTPAATGFDPGEWEVVLEIVGGDDREVLAFSVTD